MTNDTLHLNVRRFGFGSLDLYTAVKARARGTPGSSLMIACIPPKSSVALHSPGATIVMWWLHVTTA